MEVLEVVEVLLNLLLVADPDCVAAAAAAPLAPACCGPGSGWASDAAAAAGPACCGPSTTAFEILLNLLRLLLAAAAAPAAAPAPASASENPQHARPRDLTLLASEQSAPAVAAPAPAVAAPAPAVPAPAG